MQSFDIAFSGTRSILLKSIVCYPALMVLGSVQTPSMVDGQYKIFAFDDPDAGDLHDRHICMLTKRSKNRDTMRRVVHGGDLA